MKQVLRLFCFGVICFGVWGIFPGGASNQMERPIASEVIQQRVMEVFEQNQKTLRANPDVLGLIPSPGTGEIWIVSDRPQAMPSAIEGVPVVVKPPPPHLPPPPGVIVLKPEGAYERHPDWEECPPRHVERRKYRWRFCDPVHNSQPLPALMAVPIAGIPYEEATAIYYRHEDELGSLPGVTSVGLGSEGITVHTNQPAVVPAEVEGLPIQTGPAEVWQLNSHTRTEKINPFHGGRAIQDPGFMSPTAGLLTAGGIVLSEGKPWLVTAGHGVERCEEIPPCSFATTLNACPHYDVSILHQSPSSLPEIVGRVGKRDIFIPFTTLDADVAAAFVDNDTTEGNASLRVDRGLQGTPITWAGGTFTFTGREDDAMPGELIWISTAFDEGGGVSTPTSIAGQSTTR